MKRTGFLSSCISAPRQGGVSQLPAASNSVQQFQRLHSSVHIPIEPSLRSAYPQLRARRIIPASRLQLLGGSLRIDAHHLQRRQFHNYFVTHLPSTSLHPDSRRHGLPRADAKPHDPSGGPPPAAPPPGVSRDLTVVRIPIQSAKHHFGAAKSRGTRPYNEDTYQAGTIEIPAFAKRQPISLSRSEAARMGQDGTATSAQRLNGDPQVFYFGIFDGHGGVECADFLRDELHHYIERAAEDFGLQSSLLRNPGSTDDPAVLGGGPPGGKAGTLLEDDLSKRGKESLDAVEMKDKHEINSINTMEKPSQLSNPPPAAPRVKSQGPVPQRMDKPKAMELEASLMEQWRNAVGGYFRRFKPEFFEIPPKHKDHHATTHNAIVDAQEKAKAPTIETVLMYAFLRCDLDFVMAQADKPETDAVGDLPVNNDEILGKPSFPLQPNHIGGNTRFKGGSTASIAMISTPLPTPFWHPSSPSTLLVAHVGDTRILLCETASGLAVPTTTDHHPSSPVEATRLRRYSATFVTDSFGEERMSGLANTRAFGDMRSKRIGVSAEPEVVRVCLEPAQYSFVVMVSDGISGTLTDQEIVDVIKEAKTPEEGARNLVSFATEVSKDGDNATALVVRLGGWERRGEGGMGSLGTKEVRDFRIQDANDPRKNRR